MQRSMQSAWAKDFTQDFLQEFPLRDALLNCERCLAAVTCFPDVQLQYSSRFL